jgi:hypothetical protein
MDAETLKMLGLPPDATADDVNDKIAELAASGGKVVELETKLAATGDALKSLKAEREKEIADARERRVAQLAAKALASGLWEPGSDRAKHFERLCALDIDMADDYVSLLTPQNPVGGSLQSIGNPDPVPADEISAALDADYPVPDGMMGIYKHALAQCGIDAATLKEYGPEAIRKKQSLHRDDWTAKMRGVA